MRPVLLKTNGWMHAKKHRELGSYIPYQMGEAGYTNSERQLEVKRIFQDTKTPEDFHYMDYESAESVVSELNQALVEKPYDIHMPYTEGENDWIIDLQNGLQLVIRTYDEYYGAGESGSGILLTGLILTGDISDEEAQESAAWLSKMFQ